MPGLCTRNSMVWSLGRPLDLLTPRRSVTRQRAFFRCRVTKKIPLEFS
jgi:hypothetical protein